MDTWLCEISASKNVNKIKYLVNCKYLNKAWFRFLQLLNLLVLRFNISKSISLSLKVLHYNYIYMVLNNRQLKILLIRFIITVKFMDTLIYGYVKWCEELLSKTKSADFDNKNKKDI